MPKNMKYQMCNRCIMDTSDPQIRFDDQGFCNHCTEALARLAGVRELSIDELVSKISKEGSHRDYDCLVGVSGGCDSTATAYLAKKYGLRPLAVHFDNGWNSELAVQNIKTTLDALKLDLVTHVVDWEEFRELQKAFLNAGVPNCEIPTDHGITACLFKTARKHGIRYILSGSNLNTESIMPLSWGHFNQDLRHLKAVVRKHSHQRIMTLPTLSLIEYLYFVLVCGLRQIPFLNYVHYDKDKMKQVLQSELQWRDYGGKHYESVWTRFFQGYYLPKRFGFDKRRAHLSSMICSNTISREEALKELARADYDETLQNVDKNFVAKKFGLTLEELDKLISTKGVPHAAYPGHFFLFGTMGPLKNVFRRIATRI